MVQRRSDFCKVSLGLRWERNLPAMQETWVRSLGQEGSLEEDMAAHSSVLAWRTATTEEPGRLQSMDPHPWDSPGKNTGVGCHFLQCMKVKSEKLLSHVRLLAIPWTAAYQALPSMGFSRQEYWNGMPLTSPRIEVWWPLNLSPKDIPSKERP